MWTPEGQQPALAALLQDTRALPFPKEDLRAINLWMNAGGGGSSIHYDPFHNLLCVVTGRKRVRLWSPALSPCLYPQVRYVCFVLVYFCPVELTGQTRVRCAGTVRGGVQS